MGKLILNTALGSIRGKVDSWVYRKTKGGFVVAKRPTADAAVPSANQTAAREQFRAASAYAKAALADPALAARYTAAASEVGLYPRAFAIKDYFHPPVVTAIDASDYHGAIGDPIKVTATDGFEVKGVKVILRSAADAVLEQGAAVLVNGMWQYTATTAVAAGTEIAVEAIATDRPGRTGTRVLTQTVE